MFDTGSKVIIFGGHIESFLQNHIFKIQRVSHCYIRITDCISSALFASGILAFNSLNVSKDFLTNYPVYSVYMRLDITMSEFMVKINPGYAQYRDRNGTVTVLLRKALYGCVQSAAL
jgi:hypothetical protein